MDVPSGCSAWMNQLASGTDRHRHMLAIIRDEPCVDDATAKLFFDEISAKSPPSTPAEAYEAAYNTVRTFKDHLTRSGNPVPDAEFGVLFRFEMVENLIYRIPDACAKLGVTSDELLGDISDEDLEALTDEYDGTVALGNIEGLNLVWVTDWQVVVPIIGDLADLVDRLGISLDVGTERIVLCSYDRSKITSALHVPRAFDGIDQPFFHPNSNCSDTHGLTRPIAGDPENGVPEGVHSGCTLTPDSWKSGKL